MKVEAYNKPWVYLNKCFPLCSLLLRLHIGRIPTVRLPSDDIPIPRPIKRLPSHQAILVPTRPRDILPIDIPAEGIRRDLVAGHVVRPIVAVGVAHPDTCNALAGDADAFPLALRRSALFLFGEGAGRKGEVVHFGRGDLGEAAPAVGGDGAAVDG